MRWLNIVTHPWLNKYEGCACYTLPIFVLCAHWTYPNFAPPKFVTSTFPGNTISLYDVRDVTIVLADSVGTAHLL